MPVAVIYARFSPRPNAAECESLETQFDRCRAYCQAKGWQVESEHRDVAVSGGSLDGRDGLAEALTCACRRNRVLVVYSISRLARAVADACSILARLNDSGADLAILDLSVDTSTPMGMAFFQIAAVFAELSRAEGAAKTSDAMLRHQASGRRMSKQPPFGWKADLKDELRWVKCEEETTALELVLGLGAEGLGPRAAARWMNEHGIKCRGKGWRHEAIRRIWGRAVPKVA